ncbi:MAG: hypothetical protein WC683_06050 [bacterium]
MDTITLAQLKDWNACEEFLIWLAENVPHAHEEYCYGHKGFERDFGFLLNAKDWLRVNTHAYWRVADVRDALWKADRETGADSTGKRLYAGWAHWLAMHIGCEKPKEKKMDTFNPKDLQAGDQYCFDDDLGFRTVLYGDDCGVLYEYADGLRKYSSFHLDWQPITRVVRDGKQIFPPPEPKWEPRVGEVALWQGIPVTVGNVGPGYVTIRLPDGSEWNVITNSLSPYVEPKLKPDCIIDGCRDTLSEQKIHDRYYLIPKGAGK